MFAHNKRLQYTVRVQETNPGLAQLMLEQFGGPQGELAAAVRYFHQYLGEADPGRRDMLIDIATEELSHLEVIGTICAMLNKGTQGRIAEGVESEAEMYRKIAGAGNDSHTTQVLYGAGPPPWTNSAMVPWTGAYIDTIGDPTCDLRSDIAAEARAKIVYERLINCTDDPGLRETLGFLMTREIAHQQMFEKALYSIQPNFPPGKLKGMPEFTNVYYNMSTGDGDARGPWNSEPTFEYQEATLAVDDGSGMASVSLDASEEKLAQAAAARLQSTESDPLTGAMLGMDGASAWNAGTGDGQTPSGNGSAQPIDPKAAQHLAQQMKSPKIPDPKRH